MKRKRLLASLLLSVMLAESGLAPMPAVMLKSAAMERQVTATNVALGKTATSSGNETNEYTPDKAVDGDTATRWSSGNMKSGTDENANPQWLMIDLGAEETQAETIKITFNAKAWSTKYRIETSDTNDSTATWTPVYNLPERASAASPLSGPDVIQSSDMETTTLKRYVRIYFEKRNTQGWTSLAVNEIEIMGVQAGKIETAAGVLSEIQGLTVNMEDQTLSIPQTSEKYEVSVYGSEIESIIGRDGKISSHHIEDRDVKVILQAVNKEDPTDIAKKSYTVRVPANRSLYPEIYKEVAQPNDMPQVLPTLQEWHGLEGNFTLNQDSAIVVNDTANVGLDGVAQELQQDLKEICGVTLPIKVAAEAGTHDIYLESQEEDAYGTGEEGYFITVDDGLKIYSSTKTGVQYGTVSVEQILCQDAEHSNIPKGIIRDYPLYKVRGVMMDVARIPTRTQFLEDYTKIFKWYKLNLVQLHLNDNQWSEPAYSPQFEKWENVEASHRLYSDTFPHLATQSSKFQMTGDQEGRYDYYFGTHTGKDGELYYTKDEYRKIRDLAADRGITVVPELDTPSHAAAYTKYVYQNQKEVITSLVEKGYLSRDEYLDGQGNIKAGKTFYIHHTYPSGNFELLAIDTKSTNETEKKNAENARIFMKALFDEYMGGEDPLFNSGVVSAGVDEYWDKGTQGQKEAFRDYMNYMNNLLGNSETGYNNEVLMWGSMKQFTGNTEVAKDITLLVWNCGTEEEPLKRMQEGYSVINVPQPYFYTTPGRYHKDMIREQYVYDNWEPEMFTNSLVAEKGDPLFKGAMTALWGDENREGITEADLHERYQRAAALLSEKTWSGTRENTPFVEYAQKYDRVGEGPGTQIANNIESKTNVVLEYNFENTADDKKTVYDASGNGYHGSIEGGEIVERQGEKWMKFDGNTTIETPLNSLGYPYTMSFDICLDGNENNTKDSALFSGYDGRLQVAGLNGELGLNRDYFTQSFGYRIPAGEKHRITVVGTYGVTKLYVDGVFTKILYAQGSDPSNSGSIGNSTWKDSDNNYRTTFVFPMNTIGKNFSGYLNNIKAYNKALFPEDLQAEGQLEGQVDVARNRPSYAQLGNSSFWGDEMRLYPSWKATDGDGRLVAQKNVITMSNESRWNSSDRDTDSLFVDLGSPRKISKVVIDWESTRYAANYEIQVSNDQKTWKTVKTVQGNTSNWTEDTFEETEARYVKMQGVRRAAGHNEYSIWEMKVYGNVSKETLSNTCEEMKAYLDEKQISQEANVPGKELYDLYVEGKAVLSDVLASAEEVETITEELLTAKAGWDSVLEKKEQTLLEMEKLLGQEDKYEKAGWDQFILAYNALKDAKADIGASELEGLVKALETAKTELKEKAPETQETEKVPPKETESTAPETEKQEPPKETEPEKPVALKKGDVFTTKDAKYRVVLDKKRLALEYVKPQKKNMIKYVVPKTVTYQKTVYPVVSIAKNAFKNNKKLKKVIVGNNVSKIGSSAFKGCKNLKNIKLTTNKLTKKSIGKNVFKGIHSKAVIHVSKSMQKKYQKMLKGKGIGKAVRIKK